MAIAFRTGSTVSNTSGTGAGVTSLAHTLSSSIQTGDLVLVGVASGVSGGGTSTVGLTGGSVTWASAGSIPLGGGSGFGTGINLLVFWAIAVSGTSGASLTGTSTTAGQMIIASGSWTGANGVDVFNSTSITGSSGATTMTEPTVTTTLQGDWLVDVLALWTVSTATVAPSYPVDAATQRVVSPSGDFQILAISDSNVSVAVGGAGGGHWSWTGAADGCGAVVALKASPVALTVTATQGGSTFQGMGLQVLVLDNAIESGGGSAAAYNGSSLAAKATLTPNFSSSYIAWALASDATVGAPAAASNNSFFSGSPFHDTTNANYYSAGYYTGTITSGTGVTVGSSTTVDGGAFAAYEIQPNGTISLDAATPAYATTMTATTVTTASFNVPYGAVLVAVVACDGSGSGAETVSVSDTSGLLWTQRAIANTLSTSYQAAIFTATLSAIPAPPVLPGIPFQWAVPALAVPAAFSPSYIPPPNTHAYTQTLTALAAAAGFTPRKVGRPLGLAVATNGALIRALQKTLAAVIVMTAIAVRKVSRIVAGNTTATSTAMTARKRFVTLVASLVATANVTAVRQRVLAVSASVAAIPVVVRAVSRTQTATAAVTGTVRQQTGKIVSAPAAAAGAVTRLVSRGLPAVTAVTAIVTLAKVKQLLLAATLVVAGPLTRQAGKSISGQTAVQGTVSRNIVKAFAAIIAVISVTTATKAKQILLSAFAAATGAVTRQTGRQVTTPVAAQVTAGRSVGKNVAALAAIPANAARALGRQISALITATSTVNMTKVRLLVLSAVIAVTSTTAFVRMRGMLLSAAVTVTAAANQRIAKTLAAPAAVSAAFGKGFSKLFTASIAVGAATAFIRVHLLTLAGNIASVLTVKRGISKNVPGGVALGTGIGRAIYRTIQGSLAIAGQTVRQVARTFSGNVNVVVAQSRNIGYIIAAGITVPGTVFRFCGRVLAGSAAVAAKVTRNVRKTFTSPVAVPSVFNSGRVKLVLLAATVSASASVTAKLIQHLVGTLKIRVGVPFARWVTSTIKSFWET